MRLLVVAAVNALPWCNAALAMARRTVPLRIATARLQIAVAHPTAVRRAVLHLADPISADLAAIRVNPLPIAAVHPGNGGPGGPPFGGPPGGGPPPNFHQSGPQPRDWHPNWNPNDNDWRGRFNGAPWGGDLPPWGWGPPPPPPFYGPLPPPFGPPPPPINYWGYNEQPVWDQGFNQWGFWFFGIWIPLPAAW
jgi:hypothetical protein